jgi:hypothetical protein
VESCGASVLGEATVFVEASVIVGATVLERMFVGATVLEATVLGGAWCSEVDAESVGDMGSCNRTGTGRCEKSCKHIYMYILRAPIFLTVADRLAQSIIYGFFFFH